jgi:hypothetical protein
LAAQDLQENSGIKFGMSFTAVQTDVFGDSFFRWLNNSEPTWWESLIPIYGSFRNMWYNFAQGNTGWGFFYAALAVVDIGFISSAARAVVSVGRGLSGTGTLLIRWTENGGILHAGWEVAGRYFHAMPLRRGGKLILQEIPIGLVRAQFNPRRVVSGAMSMIRLNFANFERAIPKVGGEAYLCITAALTAWNRGNYWLPAWTAAEAVLRALSLGDRKDT